MLDGLLIAPGPYRVPRLRVPHGARAALVWTVWVLLLAARIDACWQAPSRIAWCGRLLIVASGYLLMEGWQSPARLPWWIRRPVEVSALVALASACRLPRLPTSGGGGAELAVGVALLAKLRMVPAPGAPPSLGDRRVPASHLPLRNGKWYIAQGGGASLNHHASFPEQRGALDVIQIGRGGARTRHRPARGKRGLPRVRAEPLRPV